MVDRSGKWGKMNGQGKGRQDRGQGTGDRVQSQGQIVIKVRPKRFFCFRHSLKCYTPLGIMATIVFNIAIINDAAGSCQYR